jgi:hypothetical protein
MDQQQYVIHFDDASTADANRYASELRDAILDASPDVAVEQRRDDEHAQDFGATLVLLAGTPAAMAVARAIGNWVTRTRGTITITDGDTRIVVENVPGGEAQLKMIEKIARLLGARKQG